MKQEYISISKKTNKILISNRVFDSKYILKERFLKPLNDNELFNEHISCEFNKCACKINPFVWVSKKHKAIWFEIPKSASRSIVKSLGLKEPFLAEVFTKVLSGYSKGVTIYYEIKYKSKIKKFLFLIKIYNLFGINLFVKNDFQLKKINPDKALELYPNFYSFGVIRNPYERMVSNYKMFTQKDFRFDKIKDKFRVEELTEISFEEFVVFALENINHHWERQIKFLPTETEKVSLLLSMDDINLKWKIIADKINVFGELEELNTTKKENKLFSEYYNQITFDLVTNFYKKDIELYNIVIDEDISNSMGL